MKLFQKIKSNPLQAALVLMVPVIVFFALIAPWLFTTFSSSIIFNEDTGHIGNTFGIMSPFIAIAAVIVTYLAFRMQLDANEKMFDNSRRMQFERQFHEMLKIHCDNVKSLHAESSYTPPGSDYPVRKAAEGREFFTCLLEEFNLIYDRIKELEGTENIFDKAYHTFFFGIDSATNKLKKETIELFRNFVFQNSNTLVWHNHPKLISIADSLCKGRIDQLVPYYRHLFLLVKTVAQADKHLFSYADKRQFLRILRAQLSSAEQILLYYNWKSDRAKQWEEDSTKPGSNHFFTDYRIIHNIIPKDCWAFNSDEILHSLLEKNPHYEKLNDEDTLFELIEENGA